MAKSSPRQRRTEGRVMHEFKHGELKRGRGGKGGRVKNRKQAIAIALHEAGASRYEGERKSRASRAKTERKEARGQTAQQEREGKSHIGAQGRRESTSASGGKNATRLTSSGKRASRTRARRSNSKTRAQLYKEAKAKHIPGRSKMSKVQLENRLGQ